MSYAGFVDVATLHATEMTFETEFMNDLILQPILFMGMLSPPESILSNQQVRDVYLGDQFAL